MFPFFLILIKCEIDTFSFSSNEELEKLKQKVAKCISFKNPAQILSTKTTSSRKHYKKLLDITKIYRKIERPSYNDCNGPFLEEEFIKYFRDMPLPAFGGLIPLFVQWFALWKHNPKVYLKTVNKILSDLEPNYLYLIISESDYGFNGDGVSTIPIPSNIIVLSASGMGHVAVPWLQCNIQPRSRLNYQYFMSFCGNFVSSKQRKKSILAANAIFGHDLALYRGNNWKEVYSNSSFGYSPRGISVSTYRTYELIRLHVIPVVESDTRHWLPYYPVINWTRFSIITSINELPRTYLRMKAMTKNEILSMQSYLNDISETHFQWDGVFKQISLFFKGGNTSLTCNPGFLT